MRATAVPTRSRSYSPSRSSSSRPLASAAARSEERSCSRGTLAWFLYLYASLAVGIAFNELFLVYVALFSASLFGFTLAFVAARKGLEEVALRPPPRGLAVFMLVSGGITLVVWVGPLLGALLAGSAPERLETSTTMVTDALDLAVITPSTVIAAVLLLRRERLGYLLAGVLLVLLVILAPVIGAQTASQLLSGVSLSPGEVIGPLAGFLVLGLIAVWFLVRLLRAIPRRAQSGDRLSATSP